MLDHYIRDTTANAAASAKVYILLFTCASSRAVHLELLPVVPSLNLFHIKVNRN